MDTRRELGRRGEDVAARLLQGKGFGIVARNWRCAAGELDIVAVDGPAVVAVEVKTRRSMAFGSPLEAVTDQKAQRLRGLLARWLSEHPQHSPQVRIDVVAVLVPATGPVLVQHLRGVA